MSHAKKYLLIDPIKYEQLLQSQKTNDSNQPSKSIFTHPNVDNVHKLDTEMKSILNNEKLTDFDKTQQYNSKLQSYLKNFKSALEVSKHDALLGKSEPTPVAENNVQFTPVTPPYDLLKSTIDSIPSSYRDSATKLVSFLKSNKAFTWNEAGELKYNNSPLQGVNISQLINDAVRSRQVTSKRATFEEFTKALNSEGFSLKKTPKQHTITPRFTLNPTFKADSTHYTGHSTHSPKIKKPKKIRAPNKPYTKFSSNQKKILQNWSSLENEAT